MNDHLQQLASAPETFKFYGQFEPPVDKFLFERYFQGRAMQGVVIECGAFDGQLESSCAFFEESLGWKAINLEASPAIYAALVKNRPLSTNLNVALSNQVGTAEFVDVELPGYPLCTNGSLSHLEPHRQWLDSVNCSYSKCQVQTWTYKKLVEELNLETVNLMVLDVEGHELQALEGFVGATALPEILCVEHGHLGIEAITNALKPLGYDYGTSLHVNSYYILTQRAS